MNKKQVLRSYYYSGMDIIKSAIEKDIEKLKDENPHCVVFVNQMHVGHNSNDFVEAIVVFDIIYP